MNKLGFDFDEFGGNVDVVILESDSDNLNDSHYIKTLQGDGQFKQLRNQHWSVFEAQSYYPEQIEKLAKELSKEFSIKAIYFYFGDASGWMGYKFFENGNEREEYSFGENYEEEMAEMGIEINHTRKNRTVVANDKQGNQFVFWSQIRLKSENEICDGEKFIDGFLRIHEAYIGWNLFDNS